ncbi:hypothetical protein Tco_0915639, partial [Tanacetum coccineum]
MLRCSARLSKFAQEFIVPPSKEELLTFLFKLRYTGELTHLPQMFIDHMHQPWRTGIVHKKYVDFAELIWEDFSYQIDNRQLKKSRHEIMPYPRFTKFVKIGKDVQEYGREIPDAMLTEDIKQSETNQMFIKYSTGLLPLKKTIGKGSQGKKATITPKHVSVEVSDVSEPEPARRRTGISKIFEAAKEEAARQVHATHEWIVTYADPKPARRRPLGIAFIDTSSVSKKISPGLSQKLKGIQTLTSEEQLIADTMQVLKASRLSSRSQPLAGGSSEGTGTKPRVLDESTVIIVTSSEGTGTIPGVPDEVKGASKAKADPETDDEFMHGDEYVRDDVDKEMKDAKVADTRRDDQEITDVEKGEVEKIEEVKDDNKKSELPPISSSLSVSSEFGNQFLAHSSDISLTGTLKHTADVEINSLLDIQIQQEVPQMQTSATTHPLPHSVSAVTPILQQTTTPIPIPPITTEAPPVTTVPNPLLEIIQRVSELEKDVQELKQVNHSLDVSRRSSISRRNPAHKALYHALMESLLADEEGMDQGVVDLLKKKRQHDDQDEDPSAGPNQVIMDAANDNVVNDADQPQDESEPKTVRAPRNDWFTQPPRPPTPDPEWNKGKEVDDGQEQTWFNDLLSVEKGPLTFDKLMATPIDFSKFVMNRLKIDKLTKAYLVGLVYNLMKGTCQNNIELEYNMEEYYKALSDQLDWNNPEGDHCPFDLSKPLPLKGHPGRLTVPSEYFFKNSLKYLKSSDPKKKYTKSITKTKAARYELVGPKRQLFYRSQLNRFSKHDFYSHLKILSVKSVKVNKLHGYGYLEEIKKSHHQKKSQGCSAWCRKLPKDAQYHQALKRHSGISAKELYTPSFDPPGVVYEDLNKKKRVMRADDLYKFSDGTLKLVCDELHHRILNFRLGYNKEMSRRKWSATDKRRSELMVELIDKH